MSLLRTFIAIEIPPKILKTIEQKTASLQRALPSSLVRWVPPGSIHLTLKFFGDVSPANVEALGQMLTHEARQHATFEIQFRKLGVFPNLKQPRVIWIGIQASEGLSALHRGIETASTKLGYPIEKRSFSPHLTIGRIKQNTGPNGMQQVRKALENTKIGALGSARINAFHIFKSELKQTGAVYTRLREIQLEKE